MDFSGSTLQIFSPNFYQESMLATEAATGTPNLYKPQVSDILNSYRNLQFLLNEHFICIFLHNLSNTGFVKKYYVKLPRIRFYYHLVFETTRIYVF